jgi:hypothetical protein
MSRQERVERDELSKTVEFCIAGFVYISSWGWVGGDLPLWGLYIWWTMFGLHMIPLVKILDFSLEGNWYKHSWTWASFLEGFLASFLARPVAAILIAMTAWLSRKDSR